MSAALSLIDVLQYFPALQRSQQRFPRVSAVQTPSPDRRELVAGDWYSSWSGAPTQKNWAVVYNFHNQGAYDFAVLPGTGRMALSDKTCRDTDKKRLPLAAENMCVIKSGLPSPQTAHRKINAKVTMPRQAKHPVATHLLLNHAFY